MKPLRLVIVLGLLSGAHAGAALNAAEMIRHDPFLEPPLPEPVAEPLVEDIPAVVTVPKPLPELRGILHSPRATLVDLDGELVSVGGSYDHFVVIAVGERNAVLLDGTERRVISIDDVRPPPEKIEAETPEALLPDDDIALPPVEAPAAPPAAASDGSPPADAADQNALSIQHTPRAAARP